MAAGADAVPVEPTAAAWPATAELAVGRVFATGSEAMRAVQDDALRRGKSVRVAHSSDSDRLLRCRSPSCGFFARFYRQQSSRAGEPSAGGSWVLASMRGEHSACDAAPRPTRRQIAALPTVREAAAARLTAAAVIARVKERNGISLARHKRSVNRALADLMAAQRGAAALGRGARQADKRQRAVYLCSACGLGGHNKRTCPRPSLANSASSV